MRGVFGCGGSVQGALEVQGSCLNHFDEVREGAEFGGK